jgi:hypothetical protein
MGIRFFIRQHYNRLSTHFRGNQSQIIRQTPLAANCTQNRTCYHLHVDGPLEWIWAAPSYRPRVDALLIVGRLYPGNVLQPVVCKVLSRALHLTNKKLAQSDHVWVGSSYILHRRKVGLYWLKIVVPARVRQLRVIMPTWSRGSLQFNGFVL